MILLVHPLSLVVTHHPSSLLSWWRLFCPSSTNWFLWSSLMSLVSHLSNWLLRNILCPPSSNWLWQNIPLAPHLSRTRQGRRCRSIGSNGDRRRVCILAVALQFSAMHSARRASIFVIDDKMSAVGSSCVVRHDVPLERTHDVGGKFCKCVFWWQLLNGNYALCIINAKRMHKHNWFTSAFLARSLFVQRLFCTFFGERFFSLLYSKTRPGRRIARILPG